MTALDGLIGGIRQIYLAGVEATFKRALDFTDMAGEILSDRIRLTVSGLRGVAVADTAPTAGDVLTYDGSEWTPSALAPVGATLFVDAVNGNDTSGTRGRADLPYRTIGAAVAAASSGDVVQVGPGSFTESVTLKNIAELTLRGSGTHATKLTGALTTDVISRTSSTSLTALTIEQMSIATNGEAKCIVLTGSSVATPGYAVGASDKGIILRDLVLAAPTTALLLTCIGKLRTQDIKLTSGAAQFDEIGAAELRNLDTGGGAFASDFDNGGTKPNGYASGTTKIYSGKLGACTLAGSQTVTADASCELGAVTLSCALETGATQISSATINTGGTITSYGASFDSVTMNAGSLELYGGSIYGTWYTSTTSSGVAYNSYVGAFDGPVEAPYSRICVTDQRGDSQVGWCYPLGM